MGLFVNKQESSFTSHRLNVLYGRCHSLKKGNTSMYNRLLNNIFIEWFCYISDTTINQSIKKFNIPINQIFKYLLNTRMFVCE